MLDYLVLYQSETGNTQKVAATIFSHLPGNSKDLIDITTDKTIPEAKIYFIGFCVHQGTCSIAVSDFLESLSDKQIALFGTCGMCEDVDYYAQIEKRVSAWIESDNKYLGTFLCQGKMPQLVRQKYEHMKTTENASQINKWLQNFDAALPHPDSLDMEHAKVFVEKTLKKCDMQ